jgi:hypothetical protein
MVEIPAAEIGERHVIDERVRRVRRGAVPGRGCSVTEGDLGRVV